MFFIRIRFEIKFRLIVFRIVRGKWDSLFSPLINKLNEWSEKEEESHLEFI